MSYTDALGTWTSMGTLSPTPNNGQFGWEFFPDSCIGGELFRARFTCADFTKVGKSFLLLRYLFPIENTSVSRPLKISPQSEPQLIEILLPEKLKSTGITVRDFLGKRGTRYRSQIVTEINWSVEIEYS